MILTAQLLLLFIVLIRCLLVHSARLSYQLKIHKPHLVLIQESWLNASTEKVILAELIERRDRSESENRGGVAFFAREGMKNIVHFIKKFDSERVWHFLHPDHGSIAIGNWYRFPSSGLDQIEEFANGLREIKSDVIVCILMGDMNIHQRSCLTFSCNDSEEGRRLKKICEENGMLQLIRESTRKENLLDLLLSDIDNCTDVVSDPIADLRVSLLTSSSQCQQK